ncbi:hypothetical protein DFP74_2327 [Nocardiopsis sp. Huas11]|uniref:hypothetical protein n=1 Tax=Nocardiopsis sp. Huas11 TaxID=2183912 RepID=UPI000F242C28|nr:hypothetical protein [Nocardiopsis sp. Huas11]RKS06684.1 hypothetical protein DFP74_2327 [Nocardiopsis sp. Huas11]
MNDTRYASILTTRELKTAIRVLGDLFPDTPVKYRYEEDIDAVIVTRDMETAK